jgi:hypothetical protein
MVVYHGNTQRAEESLLSGVETLRSAHTPALAPGSSVVPMSFGRESRLGA